MKPKTIQKISTCLWFDTNAEEAVNFYLSVFPDGRILNTARYGENAPLPAGTVLTIEFIINGQEFLALNGGPVYKFTPAVSFVVNCATQEEVDYYWSQLTADGGEEVQCGWLTDKFGVSWQVVPTPFLQMMTSPDQAAVQRMTQAMFQMKKLDLPALKRAFDGK
jgi:predicted 3-demethylubiquinone-9 3-methyltransferase (glyoxalase superfamily)